MAFAEDYNDVASRIRSFREKYPEGSLQPADPLNPYRVETIGDRTFIVYAAAAYRDRDDQRPGIGVAWELFPGKTNFTRDSELMNAETSAWGRAIVAALASDAKKVASQDEVTSAEAARPAPKAKIDALVREAKEVGLDEWVKDQQFPWPWPQEVCDAVRIKIDERAGEPF
jgi:hypothetical protein